MTCFFIHLSWFIFFLIVSLAFLLVSLYVSVLCTTLTFSLDMFSSWFINLTLTFSLDMFSSWFSFVVSFISAVVIVYSYFYMSPYSKPNYFIWLTTFFVLSMLFVINTTNFFFIMLGWDGLGLVSFLLIVYYQNYSSIYSGLFTVLINRIGDCFFIVSISLIVLINPLMWVSFDYYFYVLIVFMILTFITNSAIFPFSPWLPLAIAAPTPISALVHSSTLVTAGLYLFIRFSYIFYTSHQVLTFFLIVSVFTSFYAGLNSVFETDINKLIALSTLSHLGFIGLSFSCGLLYLSFFHLLVHALFNSVLFISIGDIITNLFHSQDIRFLSFGFVLTPSSFYTMAVSLMNLLGLPAMSGYYSKDLVLETCNFSYSSQFVVFFIFFNVIFTFYYTYKLFYYSFSIINLSPYMMLSFSTFTHTFMLLVLSFIGICFGLIWITCINFYIIHVTVPFVLNLSPFFLNFLVFIYLFINLNMVEVSGKFTFLYFSNMMFLSCFMLTVTANLFLTISFYLCKSTEYGVVNWSVNKLVPDYLMDLSLRVVNISLLSPASMLLVSLMSLFLFYAF